MQQITWILVRWVPMCHVVMESKCFIWNSWCPATVAGQHVLSLTPTTQQMHHWLIAEWGDLWDKLLIKDLWWILFLLRESEMYQKLSQNLNVFNMWFSFWIFLNYVSHLKISFYRNSVLLLPVMNYLKILLTNLNISESNFFLYIAHIFVILNRFLSKLLKYCHNFEIWKIISYLNISARFHISEIFSSFLRLTPLHMKDSQYPIQHDIILLANHYFEKYLAGSCYS